jgi:segregation and condensation protein B
MLRHPLAWRPFGGAGRLERPADRRPRLLFRFEFEAPADVVAPEAEGGRDARLALVEAALFAADEPLSPRRLAAVAGLADAPEARRQVRRLRSLYDADGSAFQVEEVAGGFQLLTRPEFHPWLARLRRGVPELRLTPALLETLSVVAYRQPVPRADVEAVRGVQCGEALRQLMEKGLVRMAGRDDSLGRPVLYATTRKFLQAFGLNSLRDLPQAAELRAPAARKAAETVEEE